MNPSHCPFCRELSDPGSFAREILPEWPFEDRIIARNAGAALVPGLGPVVPRTPYALVMPQGCSRSFLETPPHERAAMLDLIDALLSVDELYPEGMALVFEHGGTSADAGCSCIGHCHLHIMNLVGPWASVPAELCRRYATEGIDLTPGMRAPAPASPYLFAGFYGRGTRRIRGSIMRGPCGEKQLFRHMLAELAGEAEYDYRLRMHTGTMVDTYRIARDRMRRAVPS